MTTNGQLKWITVSPKPAYNKLAPLKWWYVTAIQIHDALIGQEYYAVTGLGNLLHWHILIEVKDSISYNKKLHMLYRMGNVKIKACNSVDYLWDVYIPKNLQESYSVIGIEDCWITNYTKKRWIHQQYTKIVTPYVKPTKGILEWLQAKPEGA